MVNLDMSGGEREGKRERKGEGGEGEEEEGRKGEWEGRGRKVGFTE